MACFDESRRPRLIPKYIRIVSSPLACVTISFPNVGSLFIAADINECFGCLRWQQIVVNFVNRVLQIR